MWEQCRRVLIDLRSKWSVEPEPAIARHVNSTSKPSTKLDAPNELFKRNKLSIRSINRESDKA